MSFQINTNINAMDAQRFLNINSVAYSQSVQRLSSGLRINSAADDAAGLAISQKLQAQVNGLNQASRNAQDGISMVQTADGAASQIEAMLQRMRELAVEGSNDTLSTSDRTAISAELTQLQSQVDLTAQQTKFNGNSLLTGSMQTSVNTATSVVQNGYNIVAGTNTSVSSLDVSGAKGATTYTFSDAAGVLTLSDGTVSQAINLATTTVAAGGSLNLNFDKLGVNLTVSSVAGETGANIATGLNAKTIITGASSGANIQIGANASDNMTISTGDFQISGGSASAMTGLGTAIATFGGAETSANAQALITSVDTALDYVNTQRANLGAYQNRLQDSVTNLQQISQNLSTAQSNIQDVNVALQMVSYTKEQILQQEGTAVLAQANQQPNGVMRLFQ